MKNIHILNDPRELADYAAKFFISKAQAAIDSRNRFSVALSGGNTPRELYARLAKSDLTSRVNWEAVHLFWGDERCVPPDHADSNYRMVKESLGVPIPAQNIHRIKGEIAPDKAAAQYENELLSFFGNAPRFDLILLGLGDDGHTASLFPFSPALQERTRWAVAVSHETPPPPLVSRVTLTPGTINAARQVVFLISGAGKAKRLAEIFHGPSQPDLFPALAIQPRNGNLLWLIDQAASADL